MRTRVKETKSIINGLFQWRFLVQELGNDGMFRTIAGGVCCSREDADKVRARYKKVGRDVAAFNKRFQHQTLTMPVDYEKRRD